MLLNGIEQNINVDMKILMDSPRFQDRDDFDRDRDRERRDRGYGDRDRGDRDRGDRDRGDRDRGDDRHERRRMRRWEYVMGKPYQIRYGDRLLVVNGG